jgi:teichuronic acid biosynthesis glycosyltransferase TuaC
MKILVVPSNYPHTGYPFSGIFNERSVSALRELCERVEVLAPRPYAPRLLSFLPRWRMYAAAVGYETRNGVPVHRPAYPQLPWVGGAFCVDQAAFFCSRRVARKIHLSTGIDAILSFDLQGPAVMAWRIGRELRIPACGWLTGRIINSAYYRRVMMRAIEHLDLVFYQSSELLDQTANLLGTSPSQMSRERHVVLSRGILPPPALKTSVIRDRLRKELGIGHDRLLVLNIGRIVREKGVLELLDAFSFTVARNSHVTCVLVGSVPAFDDTASVQEKLEQTPGIRERVRLLPACSPDKIWEYLCAADVFAFGSHHEGMPNSLLEAMVMGVPAVAFGIPPVLEIEDGTRALITVPPFNSKLFGEAILRLADSPDERARTGQAGRERVLDRYMVRKNMAIALERLARVRDPIEENPIAHSRNQ